MTTLSRLSKADTIWLSEPNGAGAAALAVDVGQERTNLTNNTTYVSESPSARTAISAPREVAIVVDLTNASSGVLVFHGNAGGYGYRVRVNSGAIEVSESALLLVSVTIPDMAAGARACLVSWCQRVENLDVVSEVAVCNLVTGAWAFGTATHAANTSATDTLVIGAGFAGSSAFSGGVTAFRKVRISRRFHSTTEQSEDFVSESSPPAMTGRRRVPMLTGPSDELLISNQGQLAGPSFLWALAATRQADTRTVTPLVNVVPKVPYLETSDYQPERYFRTAPDAAVYHMPLRYLFHAFTAPKTNHAWVRIHVSAHHVFGGPAICRIYFRGYSLANLAVGQPGMPKPLAWHKTADAVISSPTTATWLDLGALRLSKETSGLTYLALAFSFNLDAGGPLDAETAFTVNAITAEPYYGDLGAGGWGDVDEASI